MNNETIDDYWHEIIPVARLHLPPQDHEHEVFFLWHHAHEQYGDKHGEIGIPLIEAGARDYIHVKACFCVPRMIVTVGLTPTVPTNLGEGIGQVLEAHQAGSTRIFLAGLQAWYYGDVNTLMLWEVDLFPPYNVVDPAQNFLLAILWQCFEQTLLARFPACERIVTPGWEPQYEGTAFRQFLMQQGYVPHRENTYHKVISHP